MKNLLILSILSTLFIGCQSASNYLHSTIMPKSEFIKNTQLALDEFRQNRHKESQEFFQKAVAIYKVDEKKPIVALSKYLVMDYHGEGYDKVFIHNYNALNYLLLGDLEGAMIESKNSNFIQVQEREKLYNEIKEYKKVEDIDSFILDRYERLFKSVNTMHNPYQNPFAYYISALLYEEYGNYDDAIIDIQNGLKFYSDSKLLKNRLRLYRSKTKNLKKRRVELFFDIGKSPIKKEINIEVKTDKDKKEMLKLPTFELFESDVKRIVLSDSSDRVIAKSETLTDVDAIKVNEFKAKLPSLTNKIFCESSKEVLKTALAKSSTTLGATCKALTTIYSKNNLHTWANLPKRVDILSFIPKDNEIYKIKIIGKNGKILGIDKLSLNCSKKRKNCYHYIRIDER